MEFLEIHGIVPGAHAEVCNVLSFQINTPLPLQLGEKPGVARLLNRKYIFVEMAGLMPCKGFANFGTFAKIIE